MKVNNINKMDNLAAAAHIVKNMKKIDIKSDIQSAIEAELNKLPVDTLVDYLTSDDHPGMFRYIQKSDINPGMTDDDWNNSDFDADFSFVTAEGVKVDVPVVSNLKTTVKVTAYISLADSEQEKKGA